MRMRGFCLGTMVIVLMAGMACDEEGVRILANGCPWPDATECSGWKSVQMAQDRLEEDQFQNGTTLCMEDCCLTIHCP